MMDLTQIFIIFGIVARTVLCNNCPIVESESWQEKNKPCIQKGDKFRYHCFWEPNEQIEEGCYEYKECFTGSHPVIQDSQLWCLDCSSGTYLNMGLLISYKYQSKRCKNHSICKANYGKQECRKGNKTLDTGCSCMLGYRPETTSCVCFTPDDSCSCKFDRCPEDHFENNGICELVVPNTTTASIFTTTTGLNYTQEKSTVISSGSEEGLSSGVIAAIVVLIIVLGCATIGFVWYFCYYKKAVWHFCYYKKAKKNSKGDVEDSRKMEADKITNGLQLSSGGDIIINAIHMHPHRDARIKFGKVHKVYVAGEGIWKDSNENGLEARNRGSGNIGDDDSSSAFVDVHYSCDGGESDSSHHPDEDAAEDEILLKQLLSSAAYESHSSHHPDEDAAEDETLLKQPLSSAANESRSSHHPDEDATEDETLLKQPLSSAANESHSSHHPDEDAAEDETLLKQPLSSAANESHSSHHPDEDAAEDETLLKQPLSSTANESHSSHHPNEGAAEDETLLKQPFRSVPEFHSGSEQEASLSAPVADHQEEETLLKPVISSDNGPDLKNGFVPNGVGPGFHTSSSANNLASPDMAEAASLQTSCETDQPNRISSAIDKLPIMCSDDAGDGLTGYWISV